MNIANFTEIKREMSMAITNAKRLRKNLSEVDKLENEILHQLENENKLSACDGYKFAKALKDVRVKRREIKQNLEEQDVISEKLKPFVSSYESTMANIQNSIVGGKQKYVKNFSDITVKLEKIKTLELN
jgi:predicted  nucleic acid-binding Zn-ribbon protein